MHSKITRCFSMPLSYCRIIPMLIFLALLSSQARATDISGKYLTDSGTIITLQLNITTPAPTSLIIMQNLPPGIRIKSTSPPHQKVNSEKGLVKWFVKNPSPGKLTFTLQLADAVTADQVSSKIRCKDPASGKFMTITIP